MMGFLYIFHFFISSTKILYIAIISPMTINKNYKLFYIDSEEEKKGKFNNLYYLPPRTFTER